MTIDFSKRRPVVSDADRQWSLDLCPEWAQRLTPGVEPKPGVLLWDKFVSDQAERFEMYFAHERKTADDWSRLWRKSWWPKADPRKAYGHLVPPEPGQYPIYRRGTAEFEAALSIVTPTEAAVMRKVGVLMLRPTDGRIEQIRDCVATMAARRLTARSLAMSGDDQMVEDIA